MVCSFVMPLMYWQPRMRRPQSKTLLQADLASCLKIIIAIARTTHLNAVDGAAPRLQCDCASGTAYTPSGALVMREIKNPLVPTERATIARRSGSRPTHFRPAPTCQS